MRHSPSSGRWQYSHLGGANLQGLLTDGLPVLLLTNIGQEADDLISLLQVPSEDCPVRSA